jgi:hypothetical protein
MIAGFDHAIFSNIPQENETRIRLKFHDLLLMRA